MRGFEGRDDLLREGHCLVDRNRPARDPLRQILALDELHDEGRDVGGVFEAVNRPDVWMIERREHLGFALEAREAIRRALGARV